MTTAAAVASVDQHDLIITRHVRAPHPALWRAWTDPDLLKEWWCPKPWTTEVRAFDLRPGTPSLSMTAIITMADEGAGTRYVATVMHPDTATRDRHAELGFFDGWNTRIDQLEAFAQRPP